MAFSCPSEQKVFGAGIQRKRVDFVPANLDIRPIAPQPQRAASALEDRYLTIVLQNHGPMSQRQSEFSGETDGSKSKEKCLTKSLCNICSLPLDTPRGDASLDTQSSPHEATLAHQVCLQHSYPPSHLDRNRQGLKYLASYGRDPDGRLGLGATGKGIRVPIQAKVKNDTVGLGVKMPQVKSVLGKKITSLDAKQARKRHLTDRKKSEQMQEIFYQSEDVQRYLGAIS